MRKTSIITGVCGQDGAYLAKLLLQKGHHVIGWARRNASLDNLDKLNIKNDFTIEQIDICDSHHVRTLIDKYAPDEIYNLAAQSHVGLSFKNPMQTCAVNYGGYLNILLAARGSKCRVYQAGTSEMFGYAASERVADEKTPLMPMSPYAISKTAAHWAGVNARYEADQFVSNGILFNHESPLRGKDFVTRKITDYAKFYAARQGWDVPPLLIGNLSSVRDWGHAKDYVEAMHLMLQHESPDDFVVATGRTCSVRQFITLAFKAFNMDIRFEGSGLEEAGYVGHKKVVQVSSEFYRPNDLVFLKGDASKARSVLKWEPKISLNQLVEDMCS